MPLRTIFILASLLILTQSFSQKYLYLRAYNVDSLQLILPGQVGEERVNTLNNLADACSYQEDNTSFSYIEEALTLAKDLDYQEGIAAANRILGHIYLYRSNYPEALNHYFDAMYIFEELNRKYTIAHIYFDIATTHYFALNFDKALEYSYLSLEGFGERLQDGSTVGSAKDSLKVFGGIYLLNSQMDVDIKENLEFSRKIDEMERRNNISMSMTEKILNDLEFGANYFSIDEYDSARVYVDRALAYPDVNKDVRAIKHLAMTYKGLLHRTLGEYDSSLIYFDSAFNWYKEIGRLDFAMSTACDIGIVYQVQNELARAIEYYIQAEKIFTDIVETNSFYTHDSLKNTVFWGLELYLPIPHSYNKRYIWRNAKWLYKRLVQINSEMGNSDVALSYHIEYANAMDTLNRLERFQETMELQTRYETEQKEKQIEYLSQENELQSFKLRQSRMFLFGLAGLVLLIAVLAVVIIRLNKLRDQQDKLLLQQKLLRSQMNPHFLFNSLVSIQNFIINQEPARAGKYLTRFSKLVRSILDSSFEELVTLEDEINSIEHYMELQQVRYSDKFDYSIEVDETIDTESVQIPPMLAQPMIENSIEHGIKHKKGKGRIDIRFRLHNSTLIFEVEDNGIGRKKAMEIILQQEKDHKSVATAITRDRIQVLNKRLKQKIQLKIIDLKNEKEEPTGTRVIIELPVIYH